ncbi:sigma 54-interacting transcriptional regulator [Fundidesulfovibrio soli]|uniref:sigma 54-interacting transcriptional regulator n=1 Tax=Fundidesulfovibrio soli TaxID=2922716 RepID=UPI001FAFB6B8|nr:sigma 54-interacting transcriptional regulator [Fundidesulfovibrio soli]
MKPLSPEILVSLDLAPVLDGLPLGVAVLDRDGLLVTMNAALERLTGFSRSEMAGVPGRHVLRSGLCHKRTAQEGPADTDIINRHRRRIPVRLHSLPVNDASGEMRYRLDLVEDLSALKDLERRLEEPGGVGGLVGKSPQMERLMRLLPAMAQADAPVIVIGETGTGKDAVAETIHKLSPRSREPFVRVNCGPMSPELLEAEIFGRRQPTGEITPGAFQRAGAGTVHLSDIGELPEALQIRLVQFTDEGLIRPVGAAMDVRSQARLIASSPLAPEDLVRAGKLRRDIAYRLGALRLDLPPLRERREDIEFLLAHFLELYAAKFRKKVDGFTPKARRLLLAHDYPGNVRELRNVVEFAVMVCTKPAIPPACLPVHLLGHLDLSGAGGE